MRAILNPYEPLVPLLPIAFVGVFVVGLGLVVMRCLRGVPLSDSIRATLLDVGLGLWFSLLLIATLPRAGALEQRSVELVPFGELTYGVESTVVARMIGNVLLFIPLGLLAPARWSKADSLVRIALIGGSLSLGVELIQSFIPTGRQTSVTDLLLNTTGAVLGYLIRCLFGAGRSDRKTGM